MSVLNKELSLIILLVIGLPSSEGNHGDRQKSVQAPDFQQDPTSAKDELKLKVEISGRIELEGQLYPNSQRGKYTKHVQRLPKQLTETERTRIDYQPQAHVLGKHHLLNEQYAFQKLKINAQLANNAKTRKDMQHNAQLHTTVEKPKIIRIGNQVRIELQKTWETEQNSEPSLCKRAKGQFFGTQTLEKSFLKFKSLLNSSTFSKETGHSDSDDPLSTEKPKRRLVQIVSDSITKTKKKLSVNKERSNSKTEGLDTHLTSGYARKPTGIGQVRECEPSDAALRLQLTESDNPDYPKYRLPYERPAKSPEINQLWDFINRHSRQWSSSSDYSPTFGYNKAPEHTETTDTDSRLPGRIAGTYPDTSRPVSLPKRQTSPSQPEPLKSRNAGARVSGSKGDKDARHVIKRHMKGWESSQGVPASHASTSSDDEEALFGKPQSPVNSSPQRTTPYNTGRKLRQLSNKELDNEYNAFFVQVKAREGHGSK